MDWSIIGGDIPIDIKDNGLHIKIVPRARLPERVAAVINAMSIHRHLICQFSAPLLSLPDFLSTRIR